MDKRPINKPKNTSDKKKTTDDVKIYRGSSSKNTGVKETSPGAKKPAPKKKRTWVKVLKISLLVLFIAGLVAAGFIARYVIGLSEELPDWDKTSMVGELTTVFYDSSGQPIAERHGVENRAPVSLDQVPEEVIQAFLATEDMDFYKHHGISIKAMVRSALVNLRERRFAQGASTITQMLARNALIDKEERYEKKWNRKIKEILLALQIESQYEKDEIMEMFLNTVAFGQGAYGVQAAAETFFSKDIEDLNLEESALIAGLIQRPTAYNPFRNPESATGRRSQVLLNMEVNGFITSAQKDIANQKPLGLGPKPVGNIDGPYLYFIDHAMEEAERILEEEGYSSDIYRSGYHIYTTMNTSAQDKVEELFSDPENFPEDMGEKKVQAAMLLLDHESGQIQAMMGGREYVSQRGFNRATSTSMNRQPGSVIKPITVYGPALEYGSMSPATVIDDTPFTIQTLQGPYEPTNYDGRYRGLVTMRHAVRSSINVPAIKVLNEIGTITGYNFARNLDFPLEEAEKHNLAIALGGTTHGNSPLELARAYGAFANQGVLVDSYSVERIEANDGSLLYEANPQKQIVMKEETAYMMTDMLRTVVQYGTGTNAKVEGWQTAGKTGTTQLPLSTPAEKKMFSGLSGNKDAWFAGYTSQYTAAVWMGFDETDRDHYLRRVYGGRYPALLFKKLLTEAHQDLDPVAFTKPDGVVSVAVDQKSGLLPSALTPADYVVRELFARDTIPTEVSNAWEEALICADSGFLATNNCPNRVSKVFLNRTIDYAPTVRHRDVENALAHYGVATAQELPQEAVERLVARILPEDYALMAPAGYCVFHQGPQRPSPGGPPIIGGEDPTRPSIPTVNPVYWKYFPQEYQPDGYLPPDPDQGLDPDDPLNPVLPQDPTDPSQPIDPSDPSDPDDPNDPNDPDGPNDPSQGEDPDKEPIYADKDIFKRVRTSGTESGAKIEWELINEAKEEDWTFTIWKQTNNQPPEILTTSQEREVMDSSVSPNNTYYYTLQAENSREEIIYQSVPTKIIY